jgi:hypothetical protein
MGSEEEYDEEYDEESQELGGDSFFYSEMKRSARIARASAKRSNSAHRKKAGAPNAMLRALQASPEPDMQEECDSALLRKRAMTETIETSDEKTNEPTNSN